MLGARHPSMVARAINNQKLFKQSNKISTKRMDITTECARMAEWKSKEGWQMDALKVGDYVVDTSDSGRYDRAVHRITGFAGDRAIVEYVGSVRNGRIEYAHHNRAVTHRTTAKLQRWQ